MGRRSLEGRGSLGQGVSAGGGGAGSHSKTIHEALEGQPEKPHVFNGREEGGVGGRRSAKTAEGGTPQYLSGG